MNEARVKRSLKEMFTDILGRPVETLCMTETMDEMGLTEETLGELIECVRDLYDVNIEPKPEDTVESVVSCIISMPPSGGRRSFYE